jgi:hypothetical protein
MPDYLLISGGAWPPVEDVGASAVVGLAGALAATGHKVTVLAAFPVARAAATPGLARRLRTVDASAGGKKYDLPLFEGRVLGSSAHHFVLGIDETGMTLGRGFVGALLGSAAAALVSDGTLRPAAVVGWGELSAAAIGAGGAALRLFVLPDGREGAPLDDADLAALAEATDVGAGRSLVARAVMASNAVVVPSPSALANLARLPGMAARASDEPVMAVRLGADEPPFDPMSDAALAARFGEADLGGKAECRKAIARKTGLALGPRTLLVVTGPLNAHTGGKLIASALGKLAGIDAAVIVPAHGDRELVDLVRVLAIEHPGRIAIHAGSDDPGDDAQAGDAARKARDGRRLLAAADATIFVDSEDLTGRGPALAQRYGVLPIAPDAGASGDFLVDYDPGSRTGAALLFSEASSFELVGAIRRAAALKASAEAWPSVTRAVMAAAPRWAAFAGAIESLRESSGPSA